MHHPDEQEAKAPVGACAAGVSEVPVCDLAREREERQLRTERALHEQLEVEHRIAELSRRFLHVAPGEFRACMQDGLETIAGQEGGWREVLADLAAREEYLRY